MGRDGERGGFDESDVYFESPNSNTGLASAVETKDLCLIGHALCSHSLGGGGGAVA